MKFFYCKLESTLIDKLSSGEITPQDIVFIEDIQKLWTHNIYFNPEFNEDNIIDIINDSEELKSYFQSLIPPEYVLPTASNSTKGGILTG